MCHYCKNNSHFIYNCPEFIKLSLDDKYKEVQKYKLCTNCLRMGHFKSDCKSGRCRKCSFKHNTLLHVDKSQLSISPRNTQDVVAQTRNNNSSTETPVIKRDSGSAGPASEQVNNVQATISTAVSNYDTGQNGENNLICSIQNVSKSFQIYKTPYINQVLLSTATIIIYDCFGNQHECTALLDSGSQSNLITQELCDKLNLKTDSLCISIAGINQGITNIKQKTCATIESRYNLFKKRLTFLIIPVITEKLPLIEFDKNMINIPSNLNLADEQFNVPKTVSVLLGANIFYELLCDGKLKLGNNMPVLHETRLGWIFTGTINSHKFQQEKLVCNFSAKISNEVLNENLTKFWQVEEVPQKQQCCPKFQICENYFKETTTRNPDGRFVVRLPFIENSNKQLGDSKSIALKRFYGLEKAFSK
ncbi:hypothetical protein NQ317_019920 [Molorchus minor]|uniref:CCHC-type domain-containing protein n=1 Tax=Molorchus minor TaxID=1323400 RepID=A0ABQ9K7N9_9CUCU|nr:hypothetical protein NQ317_019920 [Molorchus minor]